MTTLICTGQSTNRCPDVTGGVNTYFCERCHAELTPLNPKSEDGRRWLQARRERQKRLAFMALRHGHKCPVCKQQHTTNICVR